MSIQGFIEVQIFHNRKLKIELFFWFRWSVLMFYLLGIILRRYIGLLVDDKSYTVLRHWIIMMWWDCSSDQLRCTCTCACRVMQCNALHTYNESNNCTCMMTAWPNQIVAQCGIKTQAFIHWSCAKHAHLNLTAVLSMKCLNIYSST